jgi:hypothetical protein
MQATVDNLCAERDKRVGEPAGKISGYQQRYQRPADAIAIERGDCCECPPIPTATVLVLGGSTAFVHRTPQLFATPTPNR